MLEAWTSYVYMDDLKGVKEINIVPVCKELKEKLAKVLTVRALKQCLTNVLLGSNPNVRDVLFKLAN